MSSYLETIDGVLAITLVGFSYTGKTTFGEDVAKHLGWKFIDVDRKIEAEAQKSIQEIFSEQNGESRFRILEKQTLKDVYSEKQVVVATGGGAILDPENRGGMAKHGAVICLESRTATIVKRLQNAPNNPSQPIRPLLTHPEPHKRIDELKGNRQRLYSIADWTVHTDNLTPEEILAAILHGAQVAARRIALGDPLEESHGPKIQEQGDQNHAYTVITNTTMYPIYVGPNLLSSLGSNMRSQGISGQKASLILDSALAPLYESQARDALTKAGYETDAFHLPSGEESKNLDSVSAIYDWMVDRRIERTDPVVALGGGVVGDTAGYAAATYLRGLPLIQVPTSTLAMADASIGGKTAVDHTKGKNLIGAFYQPSLVLADITTLQTLSSRALREGFAEVIKTALILDADLFEFLENNTEALLNLEETPLVHVFSRCAALKGWIVSQDEKENGLRAILNYGHTIGHALEAITNYTSLLHGEAVSIGMAVAGELSKRHDLLKSKDLDRQNKLIEDFGLPIEIPAFDMTAMLDAMALDKKSLGGSVRWILLKQIGEAIPDQSVDLNEVQQVIKSLQH